MIPSACMPPSCRASPQGAGDVSDHGFPPASTAALPLSKDFAVTPRQRTLGLSNSPSWESFCPNTLEAPKGAHENVPYSQCSITANAMPEAGAAAKSAEGRDDSWQGNMPL